MNKQISSGVGIAIIAIFLLAAILFIWVFVQFYSQPGISGFFSENAGVKKRIAPTEDVKNLVYRNSYYGFELTFPESWRKYSANVEEDANAVHFLLPTNDPNLIKADATESAVFLIVANPVSEITDCLRNSINADCFSGYKQIGQNDKYIFSYMTYDKIGYYASDFTPALFKQVEDIIKTFKVIRPEGESAMSATVEQSCLNSGGQVSAGICCKTASDFPNSCLIGACGCAPANSHQVKTCECGAGKCFDGNSCVSVSRFPGNENPGAGDSRKNGGVQCTMEAKVCPDGTSVGRTGPNCEFAPCP